MSDETLRELLEVQAHFRLPSVALVEKDLHVVQAIVALAAFDAAPFSLVFGGGTALARAHRLVRRMSEDVDFKVVPLGPAPVSRSALRRTQDGHILLCAVNAERQQPRSYRLERIQGASVMSRGFTPRFQIELTPSGPLVAPTSPRTEVARTSSSLSVTRRRGTADGLSRAIYLYGCPVCGKRFERTSMDSTLRTHKSRSGFACFGRYGIYEGVK